MLVRFLQIKLLLLACSLASPAILGCMAAGKGAPKAAARPPAASMANRTDAVSWEMPTSAANGMHLGRLQSMTPQPEGAFSQSTVKDQLSDRAGKPSIGSRQYPFGLYPPDWPVDVVLHPEAAIAKCDAYEKTGHCIVALIPSDRATVQGAQAFHLESLMNTWQSLQVEPPESNIEGTLVLTIIAERPGANLSVVTMTGSAAFMSTLPNKEYWTP